MQMKTKMMVRSTFTILCLLSWLWACGETESVPVDGGKDGTTADSEQRDSGGGELWHGTVVEGETVPSGCYGGCAFGAGGDAVITASSAGSLSSPTDIIVYRAANGKLTVEETIVEGQGDDTHDGSDLPIAVAPSGNAFIASAAHGGKFLLYYYRKEADGWKKIDSAERDTSLAGTAEKLLFDGEHVVCVGSGGTLYAGRVQGDSLSALAPIAALSDAGGANDFALLRGTILASSYRDTVYQVEWQDDAWIKIETAVDEKLRYGEIAFIGSDNAFIVDPDSTFDEPGALIHLKKKSQRCVRVRIGSALSRGQSLFWVEGGRE